MICEASSSRDKGQSETVLGAHELQCIIIQAARLFFLYITAFKICGGGVGAWRRVQIGRTWLGMGEKKTKRSRVRIYYYCMYKRIKSERESEREDRAH